MKSKILIAAKDEKNKGGVANYFNLFFNKFEDEQIEIERFDIGSRSEDFYLREKGKLLYLSRFLKDVFRLFKILTEDENRKVFQINPSLIPLPLVRDGIAMIIAKFLRKKTIVFIRGWDHNVAGFIGNHTWARTLFIRFYNLSDCIIVLANRFKKELVNWGLDKRKIFVSRTMFDGARVQKPLGRNKIPVFLFLSRISELKGVYEIIDALEMLIREGDDCRVIFVGFGRDPDSIPKLKAYAEKKAVLTRVEFRGYLEGYEKYKAYASADVFLLPSYKEGCPNSVLEAMASGLFIICSDVGALSEVVKDKRNGIIVKPKDAADLHGKMKYVIDNMKEIKVLGRKNMAYAQKNFESQMVIDQIRRIYSSLLENH
ncbi:glycosyltransferase, group 1 family protein [delta proteobacterium NaphS2]|nr:glycosyltransferase, group 1 family protein [delta proteobacterium NaphS2]